MTNYKVVVSVIITIVSFLGVNAQKGTVYGLDKDFTKRRLRLNSGNPYVYSVGKSNFVVESKTRVKKKSEEYETLKLDIENFETHMIKLNEDFDKAIIGYNSLNKAANNITLFLNSQKPVEASRALLASSQEILNANNVNKLVYADSQVNASKKVKFRLLSSNYTNLKLHLKNVIKHIEEVNEKPLSPPNEQELAEMKEKLEGMKSYVVVEGPVKKKSISGLVLETKIGNIPSVIMGEFVELGDYTVMVKDYNSEFKKGRVIKKSVAVEKSFIKKGYAKAETKKLIKNKYSNSLFIVNNDFFKKYAFTFNGKFRYQVKNQLSLR